MKCRILSVIIGMAFMHPVFSQSLLSSTVTLHAKNQPLHEVLTIISNESNINFSYNSKSIKRDSLITLDVVNRPLNEVLRLIFNASYDFKESGSYIIIRRKPITTSTVLSKGQSNTDYYIVDGFIIDDETGAKIPDATIYEKQHLLSAMTDQQGYFSLKLKNKYPAAVIHISKADYKDTSLQIQSKINHKVRIALTHSEPTIFITKNTAPKYFTSESEMTDTEADYEIIERRWIGRVLFSSKQHLQSLNLRRFYTTKSYQISVWPGVGTHGKLNAQVSNKTSINLIGGYSGGVEVFEVGLLFNLVKKNVKHIQLAGLFNMVGGNVDGFQAANLFNQVEGSVEGVQIAGLANVVKRDVSGIQIATLYNRARSIKGLQIGFINKTETQDGTSIGLINISKNRKGKNRIGFIVRFPRK